MTGAFVRGRKVLVTGASGFIGGRVCSRLTQQDWKTFSSTVDIRDEAAVAAACGELTSQDVVIHAAALTNVDWCEDNPIEAAAVNVDGTRHVALAAAKTGARLIFFSSEYVFDGVQGPYTEDSVPNPINEYGRQKLAGEAIVRQLCRNYLIIRTTTVFGYQPGGKNFLVSFLERMRNQEEVPVPFDQVSTPTYVEDIARITADLAGRSEIQGILNIAGPDLMSRVDLARAIARVYRLDAARVQPMATAQLRQSAARPLQAGLVIDRLKSLGYATTNVEAALQAIKNRAAD